MKTRSLFLILSLTSLLAVGGGGISFYSYWNGMVSSEAQKRTEIATSQLSDLIYSYLKQHRNISAALAGARQLKEALGKDNNESLAAVNTLLDNYCSSLEASVCYLMNVDGNTIASSNRNSPVSFVGKNYSFRPYFKKAIADENALYMALGVTSRKRGIYFSSPVVSSRNHIVGVVVTKYPLDDLERKFATLPGIVALTDPNDVIFASNRSEWLFQNIGDKSIKRTLDNTIYLVSKRKIGNLPGWRLVYWFPAADSATFWPEEISLIAYAFGILFIFTITFIFSLYMISVRDIAKRALTSKALLESESKYRRIVETTNAISWELDLATWRFTYVSPHAVNLLGYPLEKWSEENFWPEHLHPDDRDKALAYRVDETKKWKDHNFEYRMIAADGSEVWLRDLVTVDSGASGTGFLRGTMIDISEIKQAEEKIKASLAEKEVLLQEIHHRVKNNLQVVSSMLSLQANAAKDSNITAALMEGDRRIRAMARVHENIYLSDDINSINSQKYINDLVDDLGQNYQDRLDDISIKIDVDDVALDIRQAISIGQIISELVSNAFKYAFPDGRTGTVRVLLKEHDAQQLILSVADDGVGIGEDFNPAKSSTLGLQLVYALATKLGGEVTVGRSKWTRFSIIFGSNAP